MYSWLGRLGNGVYYAILVRELSRTQHTHAYTHTHTMLSACTVHKTGLCRDMHVEQFMITYTDKNTYLTS